MESLRLRLWEFLKDNKSTLFDIYEEFPKEKETTIRGRLNENLGECFKRLGRGVYIATDGEISAIFLEGDTWDVIKTIETESIDAIVMDSPYSVLNKQMQIGTTRNRNIKGGWDFETRDIDNELLQELYRVMKPGGHMFSFMPAAKADTVDYNHNQLQLAREAGWKFQATWVWDKVLLGMGYTGRCQHELIHFFSKGKRKFPSSLKITDVRAHKREHKSRKIHQTQKPIGLLEDIIKFSTMPGDVVLDPFAGSGSTAAAALQNGRHSISIEIDKAMIKNACGY
jgi:site-specific DNA-methyltransferase (adenine-specific)